ncbi:protein kinase domain-containing protein [Aureispira anguillae]|uniref:Protein kinase domain-containing protein n=1 Tax=Aureispira anguillae TaxID=2864201 RepID=A0A916DWB4_9BACT|nr:hypothetical protein [Aureispira anguillae]BDS15291.1 hypothetical protein AsAng_0060750 [Aureispira anguillae]
MSNQYYLKHSRQSISLVAKPFAGGGEGDLYEVLTASHKQYVAKIYHPQKRSKEREEKIAYLIEHPPVGLSEEGAIVWVIDALYDANYQFAGFIMPFARGKKLELLCLGKLSRKLGQEWSRFDFKHKTALQYRLRVCFNLAAAIYQIHATNHYVLVDMKPENILIQSNGLLSIVDTDSVEVLEDGVAIFPAPVATPEYSPPEFYRQAEEKNKTVRESWDRFGLAVIFYKLLCGIHPFAASAKPPYDHLVSLHEKIEEGLFVHNKTRQTLLNVVPPPHQRFEALDLGLQDLFIQCFEGGHESPELRPTANEWCAAFLVAIGDAELEAHFAHIMGLWGDTVGLKRVLPSMLYRSHEMILNPKKWLENELNNFFEAPPQLPMALTKAIRGSNQEMKLKLEWLDYGGAWLLFIVGAYWYLLFDVELKTWLLNDFWLWDILLINATFIAILVMVQVIFPRLVSFGRHLFSPQVQVRRLWREFRLSYPQLQQDSAKVKDTLLQQFLKKNAKNIATFEALKEQHIVPLQTYLEQQDGLVKGLMKERKATMDRIQKKYLIRAETNALLAEMKGRSVVSLDKRLRHYYQKEINAIERKALLQPDYQKLDALHQQHINEHLAATETAQNKLMEEAMSVFQLDHFFDKQLKSNSVENKVLKSLFKEYNINTLCAIKAMYYDKNQNLVIALERGDHLLVRSQQYPYLEHLKTCFYQYEEAIDYARNHDLNYGKEYFQERYAIKRKEDEKEIEELNKKYQTKKAKKLKAYRLARTAYLSEQFDLAQLLLNEIKAAEKKEIEAEEAVYEEQYQQIFSHSQTKVEEISEYLNTLNKDYKMEVKALLTTPEMEKLKISFKKKIEKAKEDIIKLEHLNF